MRTRTLCAVLAALMLAVGACSDDDSGGAASDDRVKTTDPNRVSDTGIVQLAALAAGSPYVQGLCSIDFFHPGDEDDPLGWLVDELRDLPTSAAEEEDEVDWMIERIGSANAHEDLTETDDLPAVAAVIRARCS